MKVAQKKEENGKKVVKREIEVKPFLGTLAEMIQKHGEEVVTKAVHEKVKSAVNAKVLGLLEKGAKDEEIHIAVSEFKLGVRKPADKEAAVLKLLAGMDKGKIAELLAKIQK
jgi:hypothetical protein